MGISQISTNAIAAGAITPTLLAANFSEFAVGTKLMFSQASAPTGWTQDTSDTATNRMLRVTNTTGGGVAGSHSPIVNNVVPTHTHGFTTGGHSSDHAHGGWTGGTNTNHNHLQNVGANFNSGGPGYRTSYTGDGSGATAYGSGISTEGHNVDHAHYITTGGVSSNHTHSGTTDNGSSSTNWTPRYIDMILCAKS